jgi:hypothetical protein
MLRYIFLLAVMGFYKCGSEKKNTPSKDETVLFRTSEHNLIFSLTIDNDFTYHDSLVNKDIVLGYSIGRYKKKKDSSVIHLRINEKDTTFKYPLFKVDSILFGLTGSRKFYIITNHDRNAWVID